MRRLSTLAGIAAASAQSYPARPVTAIVPASAGGPTDTIGRIVMARAQQLLGQNIIIENVGGASGTIGTGRLVRADPDGYTIGIGGPNHYVVNQSVYPLTYDTAEGLRADLAARERPDDHHVAQLAAGEEPERADRVAEGARATTSRSEPAGSQARRISAASRCRP